MGSKLIDILKYLVFLLLGVLLLYLSFHRLDLNEVWFDIRHANYLWMFVALIFALLSHVFRALRWNLLIGSMGYQTRFSSTFHAVMIGYLANTAVPRMGELMRCGMLSRKNNVPFHILLGSVISERVFDMFILLLLLVAIVTFQWELAGDLVRNLTMPLLETAQDKRLLIVLVSGIALLSFFAVFMLAFMFKSWVKSLPGYAKTRALFSGLISGMKTIKRMRQKGLFLLYTVAIWVFYVLMIYVPFLMLPETAKLDFMAGITFLAIGSLGIVAPVPGGIGAYHFIGKAVLVELYQISGAAAGSFVAITHAGQTLLNVLVGGLSYFLLTLSISKEKRNHEQD